MSDARPPPDFAANLERGGQGATLAILLALAACSGAPEPQRVPALGDAGACWLTPAPCQLSADVLAAADWDALECTPGAEPAYACVLTATGQWVGCEAMGANAWCCPKAKE